MRKQKLACPKCKGTIFEIFQVTFEKFFHDDSSLITPIEKCVKCGWLSNTIDVDEAKRRIQVILRKGIPDWEGFIKASDSLHSKDKEDIIC